MLKNNEDSLTVFRPSFVVPTMVISAMVSPTMVSYIMASPIIDCTSTVSLTLASPTTACLTKTIQTMWLWLFILYG